MRLTNCQILYNLLYEDGIEFSVFAPDSSAIAVQYSGKPLWIYVKDNFDENNLQKFLINCVREFEKKNKKISGIVSTQKIANFFEGINGNHYATINRWEIAAFYLPKPFDYIPQGQISLFCLKDVTMVSEWIADFYEKALGTNLQDGLKTATALIIGEKLFCLKAKGFGIVAMGMTIPLSCGMSRLNLIYTPPSYRGRGFGKDMTALLANKLQEEGTLPVLYARVENISAMRLYQSLGFIEAGRLTELRFGG